MTECDDRVYEDVGLFLNSVYAVYAACRYDLRAIRK